VRLGRSRDLIDPLKQQDACQENQTASVEQGTESQQLSLISRAHFDREHHSQIENLSHSE
jgi:hypothetical protein